MSSSTEAAVSKRAAALLVALATAAGGAMFLAPPHAAPTGPSAALNSGDTAWMLTATGLVLLMTPGLSFFYGGMVRPKNMLSTMLQSFVAMGVVCLLWFFVGFSLAFGDSIHGVIGDPRTYLLLRNVGAAPHPDLSPTIPFALFALFQLKFAIITPALVTGAFAERIKFKSYVIFMVLFTPLVYCPLAHATWHPRGVLHNLGVLDFAGGTVVHMSAGVAALVGAWVIGPRKDYRPNQVHAPAHVPFVMLGTGMLWFGWFGFNAGSALSASSIAVSAFLTTTLASAAAMVGWMLTDRARGGKATALGACIGAVVGLVAVTPAAGFVTPSASVFIGFCASVLSNFAARWRVASKLDDTLDVFPCHGLGGMFGMLATGVFASKVVNSAGADGLMYGGTRLFVVHAGALVGVSALVAALSYAIYKMTDALSPLRVDAVGEEEGLDWSEHGEQLLKLHRSSMMPGEIE